MMNRGAINAWKCDVCWQLLVAVHVDDGVTPMFLACRTTEGCKGTMVSSGYPPSPIPEHITRHLAWEWHRATTTQLKRFRREANGMYEHCSMGGLILSPLGIAGRAALLQRSTP